MESLRAYCLAASAGVGLADVGAHAESGPDPDGLPVQQGSKVGGRDGIQPCSRSFRCCSQDTGSVDLTGCRDKVIILASVRGFVPGLLDGHFQDVCDIDSRVYRPPVIGDSSDAGVEAAMQCARENTLYQS